MLLASEATGHFPFNSRHFFQFGELGLAAEGLWMFISGNEAFRRHLKASEVSTVKKLASDLDGLEAYEWWWPQK